MTAALAAFFAAHIVPARPRVRLFFVERLGKRAYTALYSAVSLAILFWLIAAAGRAPRLRVWDFEPWQLWIPNIIMPFACLLIAFGVASKNPFSIAGRDNPAFDPERPGIAGITPHPVLWAITLWAVAHMVPNGDLAHVLLFGFFAVFGAVGMFVLDARKRQEWGDDVWRKRTARTSFIPFLANLTAGVQPGQLQASHFIRMVAALTLYGS